MRKVMALMRKATGVAFWTAFFIGSPPTVAQDATLADRMIVQRCLDQKVAAG
jgi:hypothetical protein